jgi:hypothetical protein
MKKNTITKKYCITIFVLICVHSWLLSTTITIKQDGTGDFTTIQAGIDASTHGDIVLVHPGTYYENIDFSGKNITVASLEFTTGDPQYIVQTVIDGQRQASCVSLISAETDAVLQGLTITNGQGDNDNPLYGGGISIFGDYPDEMVHCDIIHCVITQNYAKVGGGLYIYDSVVTMSKCSIRRNYASTVVGGVFIGGRSQVTFDPVHRCSIYDNFAGSGLDIAVETIIPTQQTVVVDTFTVLQPDRYFAQIFPGDYPITYNFDINTGYIEPVDHDLYVAPDGDDANSGLTPDDPMKTIQLAMRKIASNPDAPRTVYLAPGIYSSSANQQILPLGCKAYVNLMGSEDQETIIDGENNHTAFFNTASGYKHSTISNLTFVNIEFYESLFFLYYSDFITVRNVEIKDCIINYGGALNSATSGGNITFENVTIDNIEGLHTPNAAAWMNETTGFSARNCSFSNNRSASSTATSAGLYVNGNGDMTVEGCRFINNTTTSTTFLGWASALLLTDYNQFIGNSYIHDNLFVGNVNNNGKSTVYAKSMPYTKINFYNNTLIDNVSPYGCEFEGKIHCRNNIMRNIGEYEIALFDLPDITSFLWCSHNNILGGEDAIFNENGANVVYWQEGNIDVDPQFVLTGDDPYQLAAGSLCIDSGTPDTSYMYLPPWDLLQNHRVWDGNGNGEARIDMGCYEYNSEPWVYAQQPVVPAEDYRISNYPNPFNPSTTVCFNVSQQGSVKLHVYNIRGQRVATLVDCVSAPGRYQIQWDGKDTAHKPVAGGVYFAQLVTPHSTTAHKMILLK